MELQSRMEGFYGKETATGHQSSWKRGLPERRAINKQYSEQGDWRTADLEVLDDGSKGEAVSWKQV